MGNIGKLDMIRSGHAYGGESNWRDLCTGSRWSCVRSSVGTEFFQQPVTTTQAIVANAVDKMRRVIWELHGASTRDMKTEI